MKNDNRKLTNLLASSSIELKVMESFAVCFSLLSLSPDKIEHTFDEAFGALALQGTYFQTFFLSNGDVIVIYSDIKADLVKETLENTSKSLGAMYDNQPNFLGRNRFVDPIDLDQDFTRLLRHIETVDRAWKRTNSKVLPPVDVVEMARVEGALASVDFSNFLRMSAVYSVDTETGSSLTDAAIFTEVNVDSIALFEQMSPETDPRGNHPLFVYFNNFLQRRFFSKMTMWAPQMAGKLVSTNMNLALANTKAFERDLAALPSEWRGNVIVELQIGDVVTNFDQYLRFVDVASKYDIMVCLDDLSPYWLLHFDLEVLGPEYAKVYFSEDTYNLDEASHKAIKSKVEETDSCIMIMTGCDTVDSLIHAGKYGIRYIQGSAIDGLVRKGQSIKEAFDDVVQLDADYF